MSTLWELSPAEVTMSLIGFLAGDPVSAGLRVLAVTDAGQGAGIQLTLVDDQGQRRQILINQVVDVGTQSGSKGLAKSLPHGVTHGGFEGPVSQ